MLTQVVLTVVKKSATISCRIIENMLREKVKQGIGKIPLSAYLSLCNVNGIQCERGMLVLC